MKLHLNLAATDLAASVAFYRALLAAEPAKAYADYALFIVEDPGLELALDHDPTAAPRGDDHFGVAVASDDAVRAAAGRLAQAGFPADVEQDTTCCYARQSNVWSTDPDGRRWETYVVHAETGERDDAAAPACC